MECPVCGYSLTERFNLTARHSAKYKEETLIYSIYQCPECYSEFADPMKSASPDWYSSTGEYYGWRWEFGVFLKDIFKYLPTGRFLEVGCGEGIVLEKLKNYEKTGIDFNKNAVEKANAKGLKVYPMSFEDFCHKFSESKFDAIAFFHVLEHIESPLSFLNLIKTILNKNGLIFLSVPNPNRISLILSPREDWDYPPHHLVRFSIYGLQRLLGRAGFKILKINEQPKDLRVYITSTVELDKFLKSSLHIDVLNFNRVLRNVLRFSFLPWFLLKLFISLQAMIN